MATEGISIFEKEIASSRQSSKTQALRRSYVPSFETPETTKYRVLRRYDASSRKNASRRAHREALGALCTLNLHPPCPPTLTTCTVDTLRERISVLTLLVLRGYPQNSLPGALLQGHQSLYLTHNTGKRSRFCEVGSHCPSANKERHYSKS